MRRVLAMALLLTGSTGAQEEKKCCDRGVPRPWTDYDKGVQWTKPFDAAVERAKRENKMLLVFHLVGDMDKEGC